MPSNQTVLVATQTLIAFLLLMPLYRGIQADINFTYVNRHYTQSIYIVKTLQPFLGKVMGGVRAGNSFVSNL